VLDVTGDPATDAGAKGVVFNCPIPASAVRVDATDESAILLNDESSSSILVVSVPPFTQGYERESPSLAVNK